MRAPSPGCWPPWPSEELVQPVPATGRYRLGLRLVQLGNAALARVDLREIARPHLIALMEATGETAHAVGPRRRHGRHRRLRAEPVDGAQRRRDRPAERPARHRQRERCTSPSPARCPAACEAYTDRTITNPDPAGGGDRGGPGARVALACGEREAELNAAAVPSRRPRANLVAVLGIQGPAGGSAQRRWTRPSSTCARTPRR